ncbi:DegT/DnrJ/EryC1/StrS family aminotransferase [Agrobacterium salinitolerans]|uniref:DegT/DnrJ/EryC1/StrS family aminotransferase n=1 Tax=Agrobacterium salinitolerans TaxID=1183413 RepID=A0A4Z1QMR2_9HYPH|nr:DegT/DnrJ/EryC1/StrS family aminotransferase [Agrobacterium salinitolerans]UYZ09256.1 DegT/DnrJ/EryC1/StrS family aminotransferase [Agrobacterium salinitolerans]
MRQSNIFVTRPYLPPLSEILPYLEAIWENKILTNNGPLHQKLEGVLKANFSVEGLSLMNNGTSALMCPLMTLPKGSQVITSPFTFAATTHSIAMLGLEPVFADIDPDYYGVTPSAVEAAITPATSAILAVHTYGTPCDVEGLKSVADKYGLTLIYDSSHAFGVNYMGRSLVSYGDYSTLSFHATKSFNTFEGGAVISSSTEREAIINKIKNFGIASESDIPMLGFNGKMSELNAAVGLAQLEHFEAIREARREVHEWYVENLESLEGIEICKQRPGVQPNYSYFPILITRRSRRNRDEVFNLMSEMGVIARRYFAPVMSGLPMYQKLPSADPRNLPVANRIGAEVLCLPIYPDLSVDDRDRVLQSLKKALQ